MMFHNQHYRDTCQESFTILKDLQAPLLSKLCVLSAFTPSFPKVFLIAAFFWSQIQLFFLISRSASLSLLDSEHNFATQVLDKIDDNFFFGNVFDFPNYPRLTMAMLVITFLYLGLTALGFVYVLLALKNQVSFFSFIQKALRILIDLHPQILFYPIHINTIKLLYTSIDQGQDEPFKIPSKTLSLIVFVFNIVFTAALTIWFSINTKNKHPFASKTNRINILDLAIKIIVPFFWYHGSLSNGLRIVLMIKLIFYCLWRDWILFRFLAYYRISALRIATITHALLSSYVWTLGFGKVFHWAHQNWNQQNVTMLFWVIFGSLFVKLYTVYCHRIRMKVLLDPNTVKNTYHLLHYYEICKSLMDFKSTDIARRRMNRGYMDFVTSLIQSEGAGDIFETMNENWNTAKQKTVNRYFLKKSIEITNEYLKTNPGKLWLAKLTLARFYSKNEANYAQANHLIDEGFDSSVFQRNSFLFIKIKILHKLQANEEITRNSQKKQKLDVGEFIKLQEMFKMIQKDFIKNISLHTEFWKHFQLPKPNLLKLLNLAQKSKYLSKQLRYVIQASKLFAQHNFSEPLLICGLYFHFFQYKMAIAQTFLRDFFHLEQKNQNNHHHLAFQNTNNHHKFTSEAIYFVVSPAQNKLGQILDCSGRVGSVLGIPKDLLVGQSINALIPPSVVKYHDQFLKAQRQNSILKKTREVTTLMKDGYIASANLHVALTHVINHDLCYYVLLEPVKDETRLVTISQNGLMSSCSRNFAEDLGIINESDKDSLNIWEVCPDFENLISAKRKLGSALKAISNFKKASKGHSSLLLEETHHNLNEEEGGENGDYVRNISLKDSQLSFYPCWYRTPYEREGIEPLIYQAQIRKFEVGGIQMIELKMKKLSNFSFVPPSILRQNGLKSLKTASFQTAKMNYLDVPNTTRTEDGPQGLSSSRGLLRNTKLSPRLDVLMNSDTLDSPHLIQEGESSPKPKKSSSFRPKGDYPVEMLNSRRSSESTAENKKKLKGLLNLNIVMDQEKEEADLLGNILLSSTDEGTGAVFENAKSVRNQKILKSILESKSRKKETILFIFSFIITSIFLLVLLIWLNTETSAISKKVSTYSQVLQNAYFRSYWTIIMTQSTLYWTGAALQWVNYIYGLDVLADGFDKSVHQMNHYNQILETSLSEVKPEILELAYMKNVRIFDRDINDEMQLVGYDNTFEATTRVVTRGLSNLLGKQEFMTEINKEIMFIIDNALNDLQVSSEPLTAMIKESLFAIFGDSRRTMLKVIGGVFGVVFLFIMFSLKYIMAANTEFKRFANVLFTLQASDVKEIEHFAVTFKEILEKDIEARELLINLFDLKKNQHENNRNLKSQQTFRKTFDHTKADASVKTIYARNYAFFIGLLIFTGFTIGFTSVYYSQASSKLSVMENQQRNINSALTYVNNLAWICIELQLAPLLNFTAGTRNLPINQTIMKDVEALRDVTVLQDSLQNQKGQFSPAMETILFDFSCDDGYSPYFYYDEVMFKRECLKVADGDTSIGLLELTSRIGMTLLNDVPEFLKGPKDIDTLKKFYSKAFYDYGIPNDADLLLLLKAYEVAESEFRGLVEDLGDLQVTLAWIAVTISLVLSVVIWIFVMRKLTRMELEIKELILLVPSRVIMKNVLLKRYIVLMVRSESAKDQALKLLR